VRQTPAGLRLTDAGLRYADGKNALADLNLSVAAGESVAIIGPSGAGKTSLLHLLAGFLRPTSGQIELLGQAPWALSGGQRQRLRSQIGLIQQHPPLPGRQRVVTAVLAGKLGQWSTAKGLLSLLYPLDPEGAAAALGKLDLTDKLYQRCDQLSGGQLQRVAIARVLYQQPRLILADEPVSAMDPVLAEHTLSMLNQYAQHQGCTFIASLHAVELALAHFSRIIGVRDGRILFDQPSSSVSPDDLTALYLNEQLQRSSPAPTTPQPTLRQVPRC
jgi:phosphonate transport system ATP-binding protein